MNASRVTEIRYVGYAVPDFAAEIAFYTTVWGLKEVARYREVAYLATQAHDEHHVVRLRTAPTKRVDVIAFAADSAAGVDGLFARVKAAGCKIIHEPRTSLEPGGGYGFGFFSPDGLPFEISSDVVRGTTRKLEKFESIPETISHVVLHSPDHKEAVKFYTDVLGFKVSDWLGDFMCFLRCNEWHHRLAILPGPPSLNHVAYDLPSIDDMMRGIRRLKQQKIDIAWGPGRHTAGNNAFSYFVTPNGFAVEYTSGLERVDDATWQSQVYTPTPQIMDQWGIGVGGPHTMPKPVPEPGLFVPVEI